MDSRIRCATMTWNRRKKVRNVEHTLPQAIVDAIHDSCTKRFSSVMPFKLIRRPQLLQKRHLIKANHSVFQSHLLSITIQNNSSIIRTAIILVISSLITLNSSSVKNSKDSRELTGSNSLLGSEPMSDKMIHAMARQRGSRALCRFIVSS